jgi:uncharacterized small protein (DUF1192 family)
MADYIVMDGQEEVADEQKRLEKIETVEGKSQVSVAELKERCGQIGAEIARLTTESDAIIKEIQAIADAGAVVIAEIPSAISVTVAPPKPIVVKLK